MSKDAKDHKHRPDALRQPQRKDSFSSILSWAALQGKITASKTPSTPSSSPSAQATPGNGTRPRRHSHSTGTDPRSKARRGSSTFRRFSFSASTTIHDGASTKTRHPKTSMAADSRASPGTSKTAKNGSSEKINKAPDGKMTTPARPQSAQDKPRSAGSPAPMPKSILRVSSPEGHKRPRQFVSPETGEPTSPDLPPSSPIFSPLSPDSPPGSPPTSPVQRPMSPGATVRFAKATIHRVDVGPGRRRFLPVKRKSKSTLTYISPLDPGAQRGMPKTMLQSPTKLRRHQENQAAMGRYWLRTEEEEAQWRAEAERRAAEEAERYSKEPASPPPAGQGASSAAGDGGNGDGGVESGLGDKVAAIDKLSPLDGDPALGKVEEELAASESEDSDEEAGAKCNQEEAGHVELKGAEEKRGAEGAGEVRVDAGRAAEEPKGPDMQTRASSSEGTLPSSEAPKQAKASTAEPDPTTTASTMPKPAAQPAATTAAAPSSPKTETKTLEDAKLAESRSFFERLAEKQAAEERAARSPSPTSTVEPPEPRITKPRTDGSKPARSSSSSLSKEKPARATSSGHSSSASSSSTRNSSSSGSGEHLARTSSREKEKEKEREKEKEKGKEKEKEKEKPKERLRTFSNPYRSPTMNLKSGPGGDRTPKTYGPPSSSSSSSNKTSHSHSSSNHLHLSGRRGRRYFEDHKQKQGITA